MKQPQLSDLAIKLLLSMKDERVRLQSAYQAGMDDVIERLLTADDEQPKMGECALDLLLDYDNRREGLQSAYRIGVKVGMKTAADICRVGVAESDPGGYTNACRNCAAAIEAKIK